MCAAKFWLIDFLDAMQGDQDSGQSHSWLQYELLPSTDSRLLLDCADAFTLAGGVIWSLPTLLG